MAELPGAPDPTWYPIGSQFLDVSSSTALTVPAIPAGTKGYVEYAAILLAQNVVQWIRFDGSAVTAAITGGIGMQPGDFIILRGKKNLDLVRIIRGSTGGSMAVTYYMMRGTPN